MSFKIIDNDLNNPIKLVYLDHKTKDNLLNVIHKLNTDYSRDGKHIIYLFNNNDRYVFNNKLIKFLSRMQAKQRTYTNGINEKVQNTVYSSGYLFSFVRLFRGCYELTDNVDQNVVGYCIVKKSTVMSFYGKKKITNGVSFDVVKKMQDRLNALNENYVVKIDD